MSDANVKIGAVVDVNSLTGEFNSAVDSVNNATQRLTVAFDEAASHSERLGSKTGEAKAAIMSLGEEVGVRVPRHLAAAIASFSGLRDVLASVALPFELGLGIEVIDRLNEKIPELANSVMGFGQDAQNAYKDAVESSKEYLKVQDELLKKQLEFSLIGLSGSARSSVILGIDTNDLEGLQKQFDDLTAKQRQLRAVANTRQDSVGLFGDKSDKQDLEDQANAMQHDIDALDRAIRLLSADSKNVNKELGFEHAQESAKAEKDFIESILIGWKQVADQKKANEQVDKDAAAMMAAMTSDAKQLAAVLSAPQTPVIGPLDQLRDIHQRLTEQLEEERAKEADLAAAAQGSVTGQITIEGRLRDLRKQQIPDLQKQLDLMKQIAEATGDQKQLQAAQRLQIEIDKLKESTNQWASVAKTAEQSFNQNLTSMLTGTETFAQGVQRVFQQILASVITVIEQMVEKWVIGLFTQQEAASTANVAQATSDAAVAAAGTFAWWSSIDPPIAPAMADAAYAEGLAFAGLAAFHGGGVVPMDMPANLKGGEMVLPLNLSEGIQRMIGGDTRSSGGHTFNVSVNSSARNGAELVDELIPHLKRAVRHGKFDF